MIVMLTRKIQLVIIVVKLQEILHLLPLLSNFFGYRGHDNLLIKTPFIQSFRLISWSPCWWLRFDAILLDATILRSAIDAHTLGLLVWRTSIVKPILAGIFIVVGFGCAVLVLSRDVKRVIV